MSRQSAMISKMAREAFFSIFVFLSVLGMQPIMATRQLAESPTATELSGGLGPYLLQESKYSLFTKVAQKLTITRSIYAQGTAGWFAGPTNQTLLVVADDTVRKGFAAIAQEYKINDPDTFIDRLIDIANAGTTTSMDVRPTLSTLSKANWAAYALLAFVGSHTLSEPVNFYANQTFLNSSFGSPINLTTVITGEGSPAGDIQAFLEDNAPSSASPQQSVDPFTRHLQQRGGLPSASYALNVPRSYRTATGTNSFAFVTPGSSQGHVATGAATVYVYEVDGIFVYGQKLGRDKLGPTGDAAYKYLAQHGV